MPRSRMIMALLGVAALGCTLVVAQGGATDVAALEKRVAALEQKINTLERALNQRIATLERSAPNPQMENEARTAYTEVNQLYQQGKYDEAKSKMTAFLRKYGATNAAKSARRLSSELAIFGKPAPLTWDIEKWYQGESDIDLSADKTTLLVFWEEWCPHCRREVPKMEAIYSNLKGQGLQMIGLTKITKSSTEDKVLAFISEKNVSYPMAKESGALSVHFGVQGIPAAAVVKNGKVVWRGHPGNLSETKLKSWL